MLGTVVGLHWVLCVKNTTEVNGDLNKRKKLRFGWINDDKYDIFGWTFPFKIKLGIQSHTEHLLKYYFSQFIWKDRIMLMMYLAVMQTQMANGSFLWMTPRLCN